jgi:glycosyltransferase involved in cell wall biosynthesis
MLGLQRLWFARKAQEQLPRTVLLADGEVATLELVRQAVSASANDSVVPICTGREIYRNLQALDEVDLDVHYQFVRTADADAFSLVQRMQAIGLPYSFVIDDNFWLLLDDKLPLHRHYQHPLVRRSLESVLVGADVVLCYSEHFRAFLSAFTPRVAVVPAAFDFSLLEGLPAAVVPDGELRIGIVGSKSRVAESEFLVPVVEQVLSARPEVVFEFFGHTPAALEGRPGVRSLPVVQNYRDYIAAKVARGWLLALAYIADSRFDEYKTNNKLREFGGCSIAAIYSDTRIYRECVQPGRTGWLLGPDRQAWVDSVLKALADPVATRQVGRNAYEYVLAHHHLREVAVRWREALAPTLHKVRASHREVLARRPLLAQEGDHPAAMQTFATRGAALPSTEHEQRGLLLRETIFELQPGQEITGDVPAPVAGPYRWSGMLATYRQALTGSLEITVVDARGPLANVHWPLQGHGDAGVFHVDASLRERGRVTIHAVNRASGPVALHAMSRAGQSRFAETGAVYPVTFLA